MAQQRITRQRPRRRRVGTTATVATRATARPDHAEVEALLEAIDVVLGAAGSDGGAGPRGGTT